MWHIGIGPIEIALLMLAIVVLSFSGRRVRRWGFGIIPILILSVIVTPPDPLSMLIVGVPLVMAYVIGVHSASYIRPPNAMSR